MRVRLYNNIIASVFLCAGLTTWNSSAAERPIYHCRHVSEAVVIDGKLDEHCWDRAPNMPFKGIADGSEPQLGTLTKLIWDDRCLYVGMVVKDPDVWSRAGLRDEECTRDYVEKAIIYKDPENPEWHRLECNIMCVDKFVKVFIDPDADGLGYFEFHINPINNKFDAWYDQGFEKKWGDREIGPHVTWSCPGFISATYIDGTLNAPHDVDKGWSVEMAIPWEAFAPQVRGACPPKAGDTWSAHLGRVQREKYGLERIYWTWPVIGVVNCHLPDTWGLLVFDSSKSKR